MGKYIPQDDTEDRYIPDNEAEVPEHLMEAAMKQCKPPRVELDPVVAFEDRGHGYHFMDVSMICSMHYLKRIRKSILSENSPEDEVDIRLIMLPGHGQEIYEYTVCALAADKIATAWAAYRRSLCR